MPSRSRSRSTRLLAGVAALALTATLAACGSGDSDSEGDGGDSGATTAATALVAGLTSGDLSAVTFRGATSAAVEKDYAQVIDGMGDAVPTITLGDVTAQGDAAATATLHWSWPLTDTDTWTYDAPVSLARVQDTWQVTWGHQDVEPSLTAASVLDTTPIAAKRGKILGAGGRPLVYDRPVTQVGIDRVHVSAAKAEAAARSLARLVDVDAGPFAQQVAAAGSRAFVVAITYRSGEVPASVLSAYQQIRGAELVSASQSLGPSRTFAAPILGTVGPVTAEMIKDHPDTYALGDVAGLSGLQARYDAQLHGTPGVVVDAVASDGKERQVYRVKQHNGTPLRLTLDERLQTKAEALLAGVRPASAIVAIKPSTGAILVAANGPGNDGQNLATYGQYPPGSTFKAVSGLALLRSGLTPNSAVDCSRTVTVDGKVFENYDDYPASRLGRIPLRTALANSCNTGFISQRGRLGKDDLADAAASLGLGIDHNVGFPAYFGSVKPASGETEAAADMIGQGTVLASPMAMAGVIASLQHGSVVVPQLVEGVDGLETDPPSGITPLTASEDTAMVSMLRAVVTEGSGALLADVPGPPVIAKTGTAEYATAKGTNGTHAWMIAAQGDLAVAVFVDQGASGSGTAGPIVEAMLRAARAR